MQITLVEHHKRKGPKYELDPAWGSAVRRTRLDGKAEKKAQLSDTRFKADAASNVGAEEGAGRHRRRDSQIDGRVWLKRMRREGETIEENIGVTF